MRKSEVPTYPEPLTWCIGPSGLNSVNCDEPKGLKDLTVRRVYGYKRRTTREEVEAVENAVVLPKII